MKACYFTVSHYRQKASIEIQKGVEVQRAEDIIKDPYVFEFLDIPVKATFRRRIRRKLIQNLESFL